MHASKKTWIYAGLAVAAGVGLVRVAQPTGTGGPSGAKRVPRIGPATRGLLVGDSFAVGLSAPLRELVRGVGGQLATDGAVGTRIAQWAGPRLQQALAAVPGGATLVLVSLGTNDMKLAAPATEQAALDTLVAQLKATGATLVWIGPPTVPFPDHGVRAMLARVRVPVFRSDVLRLARGPDKIHPTAAGYAGWAGALVQWIG